MSEGSARKSVLKNTPNGYGYVAIIFHWVLATALIAMYFVGDYMVELSYYDPWYHRAPQIHKEVGVLVAFLMLSRWVWSSYQTGPEPLNKKAENINRLAKVTHSILYIFVFMVAISGYLISTAKGQGVEVFGWFEVPALFPNNRNIEELAGEVHELMGTVFMILVALHVAAALVHHLFIKDRTLKRMLWVRSD